MSREVLKEIKYSRSQAFFSLIIVLVVTDPVIQLTKHSPVRGQYYGFLFVFIIVAWVFWNIIRVTVMMLYGTPAIILTRKDITITK